MSVDAYLSQTGLPQEYWNDSQLRMLVQLLLNLHKSATGPLERFLSGTVVMTNPGSEVTDQSLEGGAAAQARALMTSTGIVREVAGELLEAAISGRITTVLLTSGPSASP
ncbi:hypothetical protein [Arthrobacter agilis]|uniref:hypothetical protein n=1 Tax=Arthrobacter agilis TaxID=37921 RepID=UPI001ABF6230|nr:hypothetical protein [Arthrobacter agilis]